jgi:sigma54-dependent transcription regulator
MSADELEALDLFDRLRKYLARFGLDWQAVPESPSAP